MTKHILPVLFACSIFIVVPGAANAAQGDCGQPVSTGANPTAADCLFILKAAVGSATCDPQCVCDTNNTNSISAADALLCLKKAVAQPITLTCPQPCGVVTTSTSTTSSSTSSSTSTITVLTSEVSESSVMTVREDPQGKAPQAASEPAAPAAKTAPRSAAPDVDALLVEVNASAADVQLFRVLSSQMCEL